MRTKVEKKTLGVNLEEDGKAKIKVWSPLSSSLDLLLIKENKTIKLEKDESGYWRGETDEIRPGDLYKFVVDKDQPLPDPASVSQPDGVHGPSQVVDLNYDWKAKEWNYLPLEEYIIYELHTGTFSETGDFAGIVEKLDHLVALGITAIEIMPVAQFPGSRNWGYDGVFPFAAQNSYGGAEGLQHLVDACHQKGLSVILDVVYNHLGPEGNYLGAYAPYFTDKYNTPWGKAINFDDAHCDGVREYFIENVLFWFRDFRIDALRMDAVHAIKDFSPKHILKEIKEHVNVLMEATGRVHYCIAEVDLNDVRFINPLEKEGYGMDAQWIDEFHHSLRVTAGGERSGYYADFEEINHLAKAYRDAYVYNGIYSPHRKKAFGTEAKDNPGKQFVVFSQNHDQVGNRMLGERTSELLSFEMQKLLAGAVLVSPYLPLLFMGEEYSETRRFQYFVSHTDPDLVEAVRKGRKAEFEAFHAVGEAPDPQSEDTFNNSKLNWDLLYAERHKRMFLYYQSLIALRKKEPALKNLNRKNLKVEVDEKAKILVLYRWHEDQQIVSLMNFSDRQQEVNFSDNGKEWKKLICSTDPEWLGPKIAPETMSNLNAVRLEAQSFSIYSSHA